VSSTCSQCQNCDKLQNEVSYVELFACQAITMLQRILLPKMPFSHLSKSAILPKNLLFL